MTYDNKQAKALFMVAWDDLNRITTDIYTADDAGNVNTVRRGLCAASVLIDELKPYVMDVHIDVERRNDILNQMKIASEPASPSNALRNITTLMDKMVDEYKQFPLELEWDVHTGDTIRRLSSESANVCRYIPI